MSFIWNRNESLSLVQPVRQRSEFLMKGYISVPDEDKKRYLLKSTEGTPPCEAEITGSASDQHATVPILIDLFLKAKIRELGWELQEIERIYSHVFHYLTPEQKKQILKMRQKVTQKKVSAGDVHAVNYKDDDQDPPNVVSRISEPSALEDEPVYEKAVLEEPEKEAKLLLAEPSLYLPPETRLEKTESVLNYAFQVKSKSKTIADPAPEAVLKEESMLLEVEEAMKEGEATREQVVAVSEKVEIVPKEAKQMPEEKETATEEEKLLPELGKTVMGQVNRMLEEVGTAPEKESRIHLLLCLIFGNRKTYFRPWIQGYFKNLYKKCDTSVKYIDTSPMQQKQRIEA